MSLHFGFQWDMFSGTVKKFTKKKSALRTAVLRILTAGIAGYGIYLFRKREIGLYMIMKMEFAFFDTKESLYVFIVDYLAVMELFSMVKYYVMYILKVMSKKRRSVIK